MEPSPWIICDWCQGQNRPAAAACAACGAPLGRPRPISAAGWMAAPHIPDLTEIQFGQSLCQVVGTLGPVAEVRLTAGDGVYFEHHTLLWMDYQLGLSELPLGGAPKRVMDERPVRVLLAQGPGRLAVSKEAPGELVALPLHPGQALDVREHAFLVASHHLPYMYTRVAGLASFGASPTGMYLDRFSGGTMSGLVILHGYGNVLERTLGAGEYILVEPGALLYKDASVQLQIQNRVTGSGLLGPHELGFALLTGPGRVGVQSLYVHHDTA